MKLWGGRFETGPSEVFEQFSGSLHFDKKLVAADVRVAGICAGACARGHSRSRRSGAVDCGFSSDWRRGEGEHYFDGADDEDVHTFVIRKLKEKTGGLADKIHTGRSRNEQVSLDTRLWLRASTATLRSRLLR